MKANLKHAKLTAILSYFSLPGWIIALVLNNTNRTQLGTFHIRQSFGIICFATLVFIIVGLINIRPLTIIAVVPMVILWLLGIISAIQGKSSPVPIVGMTFQKWFRGI